MMRTGEIPISHAPSKCDCNGNCIIDYGNRSVDTKADTVRGEASRVETPFKYCTAKSSIEMNLESPPDWA